MQKAGSALPRQSSVDSREGATARAAAMEVDDDAMFQQRDKKPKAGFQDSVSQLKKACHPTSPLLLPPPFSLFPNRCEETPPVFLVPNLGSCCNPLPPPPPCDPGGQWNVNRSVGLGVDKKPNARSVLADPPDQVAERGSCQEAEGPGGEG